MNKNKTGYPLSPAGEDIYDNHKVASEVDPEDTSKTKTNITPDQNKEIKQNDDLDVPGSELDDAEEIIGSEDEENNYYSIGGDNHNDLDENHDEEIDK